MFNSQGPTKHSAGTLFAINRPKKKKEESPLRKEEKKNRVANQMFKQIFLGFGKDKNKIKKQSTDFERKI